MGHCIIIGQTESGKSTLATKLAEWYHRHGVGVAVLDPMKDPRWPADYITDDADAFLAFVRDPEQCLQCALFVDESGESIDKFNKDFNWLTCRSRHHGHICHLITHRAQDINPSTRAQATTLYIFNVNSEDAKQYARDFNCPMIAVEAPYLPQGTCIKVERFKPAQRIVVFTPRAH